MSFQAPTITPLTQGPTHHWFGPYDLCPWDPSGRWLLTQESDFFDRQPGPEDRLRLGVLDTRKGGDSSFFAETTAWCWQTGARLQWLGARGEEVLYNAREKNQYVAVVHHLKRGTQRVLPRPVHTTMRDGSLGLSVNFARLADCRPGDGYEGLPDPGAEDLAPANDGVWRVDLHGGGTELVVSLQELTHHEPHRTMPGAKHWVSQPRYNTDDSRFAFQHHWLDAGRRLRWHRMLTARPDGSDLQVVCDYQMVSHFDWFDTEWVLTWARQLDLGDRFYLFQVLSGKRQVLGFSTLGEDGHCQFSPDRRWLVTDTYPDEHNQRLLVLYRLEDDLRLDVARLEVDPRPCGEYRCDLHPRWSRDGKQICVDSTHEGSRQMYTIDVSRIVDSR